MILKMRKKPIYEYTDKRMSVRYAIELKEKQIVRKKAEKQMGDNYFSNNKEVTNEVGRFN